MFVGMSQPYQGPKPQIPRKLGNSPSLWVRLGLGVTELSFGLSRTTGSLQKMSTVASSPLDIPDLRLLPYRDCPTEIS